MNLDETCSQEHSVDTGVPQSFILGCTLFHYISDLADDVMCNIDVILIDSSLYWKCDQTFYFWQQLEFAFGLESDQSDTVDWGRKFLVDFTAEKMHLVAFDQSNNSVAIVVKMDGFALEGKSSFKMLRLCFFSKLE